MYTRRTVLKALFRLFCAVAVLAGLIVALYLNRIHRYDDLIVRISREYEVDPRLVSAVIWRESRFDAGATGAAGEIGLMQVTDLVGEIWARAHGIDTFDKSDLYKPEINIRAGTWYLAQAIEQWGNRSDPLPYALAQYNAGRSNALRWAEGDGGKARRFMENITYPGTRDYVESVLRRYRGRG